MEEIELNTQEKAYLELSMKLANANLEIKCQKQQLEMLRLINKELSSQIEQAQKILTGTTPSAKTDALIATFQSDANQQTRGKE
jgi:hypothetical protein